MVDGQTLVAMVVHRIATISVSCRTRSRVLRNNHKLLQASKEGRHIE